MEELSFQAVSLNETQRSEMCIPQWAVSVELDSLNLESFVIGNGLHRSPVQAGAPSVVKQENDRGGKGGGPHTGVGQGAETGEHVRW